MLAAQTENCDVAVQALLNHGADPNIVDYNVSKGSNLVVYLNSKMNEIARYRIAFYNQFRAFIGNLSSEQVFEIADYENTFTV